MRRADAARAGAVTLACLALGAAFAQTFGRPSAGPLGIVILALFAALLWRGTAPTPVARAKRGAGLGLAFGVGWFAGGLWWLYISMAVFGGLAPALSGGAVLLFSIYLAAYPAAACALAASLAPAASRHAWPTGRAAGAALAFAASWTLGEWLRGTMFTGFPWLALGYAEVGTPLAGFAPILGVHGVGFAAAMASALLAMLTCVSTRGAAAAAVALVAIGVTGAELRNQHWTHPEGAPLRVALLQGNVAQGEKFRPEKLAPTLALYDAWMTHLRADLIVTPETAVPVLPRDLPQGYLAQLDAAVHANGARLLLGIPLTRGDNQFTNSVLGLGGATRYRYYKAHLVPFGEFIPAGFHWFVRMMDIPLGDFARGTFDQPSFVVHGTRIAPTICYEDLFGAQLAQRFRDAPAAPNVIANLTNLGWFGDTIVLGQHLEIARMRSLEFQLPSIRATNTGATAVIGPDGRVQGRLPSYTVGVLTSVVQGYAGITPYAWSASRFGHAPIVVLCLLVLLGVFGLARRAGT